MLWIHYRGILGAKPKKPRIKPVYTLEHCRRSDVIGIGKFSGSDPRCAQLFISEETNPFDAITEITPKLAHISGTRKSPCHTNYGYKHALRAFDGIIHPAIILM